MAKLGQLLRQKIDKLLKERGYKKHDNSLGYSLYVSPKTKQFIAFDRTIGGSLRVLLSVGQPPWHDSPNGIECESPWWEVFEDDELPVALQKAWEFLMACGFLWLNDPLAKTPTGWREQFKILVRDKRMAHVTVSWPATMSLNERILKAQQCIPNFRTIPALKLHAQLAGLMLFDLGHIPVANALELKQLVEREGFNVNINSRD